MELVCMLGVKHGTSMGALPLFKLQSGSVDCGITLDQLFIFIVLLIYHYFCYVELTLLLMNCRSTTRQSWSSEWNFSCQLCRVPYSQQNIQQQSVLLVLSKCGESDQNGQEHFLLLSASALSFH